MQIIYYKFTLNVSLDSVSEFYLGFVQLVYVSGVNPGFYFLSIA